MLRLELAAALLCSAPLASLHAQDAQAPTPPPAAKEQIAPEAIPVAIDEGLAYLLDNQNDDGSWGGTVNQTMTSGFANPATYRMWQMGTTGLAARAMFEVGMTEAQREAADRGLDYLIANAKAVRPAEWDVDNNWALVYGLDAVARALQHPRYQEGKRVEELRKAGQTMIGGLAKYQSPKGGWGYYANRGQGWRPEWATSFMTSVALLALIEARAAGLVVSDKIYDAAIRAVEYSRLPNGAYDYDVNAIPRHMRLESINQVKGSLGRIQVGNLALYRAGGSVTLEDVETGLEQFVKHHKFLAVARNKPIPHEAYYANAAYFYLFAHYYAAQANQLLPEEKRARFAPHIQAGILEDQQKDGSMWDFWIANSTKSYGTAFGVMGLDHTSKRAQSPGE